MRCPRCQAGNPESARFCEECGARLALTCPQCGAEVSSGKKFCRSCGAQLAAPATDRVPSPATYTPKHLAERILTSKAALEGERKQVTVLFADLKDSMELLADRDPEEARKLLDPVLERMMEAVHRYEGTVNQVMGDGIMALFGAPVAHEDHAVRACFAALRMQERVTRYAEEARRARGVNVQIRVGLNSGEVVVGAIGNDLRMDYTAVGQTTHLAARMEQLASPGRTLLTAATFQLAEGFVAANPLGRVPVKGLVEPVEVYEATGAGPARTRLQAAARRGLTRFVGRGAELEQLRRAQQLASTGHGQVVAIVGGPGVGKSRLVYEFTRSYCSQGWLTLETAPVSYGKTISYLPVVDLLKSYFRIEDRDDLREIREKVTGQLLPLDEALEPTLPALLTLLDAPVDDAAWHALDPGQRRQLIQAAVKQLLLREAREQPIVLIVENLHWIDGETQAVLDTLVDGLASARVLLVVDYRAEYRHTWGGKTYYSQVRLDTLPADSAGALLEALLGDDPGLAPLKQGLVRRGNPFFLEETVRTLAETKVLVGERGRYRLAMAVRTIQIPSTVQAILAARIDRLEPEHKRLLQTASVVGKNVPLGLLRSIADLREEALQAGLDHLRAAEFFYETELYPDPAYTFTHALTHEVAYSGLLQERRRELHARLVGAIETLHQDRLGEQIERLAHHALRGELRERAVHYLRQAGLRAAARSALPEALECFEQALGVLATLPESRSTLEDAFEIRLELRPALSNLGETRQTLHRLREAEALAERLTDDHQRGRVCAFLTNVQNELGDLDEALVSGGRALEIAGRLGDLTLRILTTSYLEQTHYLRGEYERVVELATANLATLPANWVHEYFVGVATPTSVWDRSWVVMSLAQLGKFGEADVYETEAMRLADATHRAYPVAVAYRAAGTLHVLKGDWKEASSRIEHGLAGARMGNAVVLLPYLVALSAWALAQLGEANEALNRLREGEQLLVGHAARGTLGRLSAAYQALGRAGLQLGRLDAARRLGDRAVESSPSQPGFAAHAQRLLGDVATHPDGFDAERGEAHYRQALALAEPLGMRPLVAHCHLGLGKLYRRAGDTAKAEEHLTTATTMYREMGLRFWREQAEAAIAEVG